MVMAFSFSLLPSCDESDDHNSVTEDHIVNGRWDITNISGGLIGQNDNYKPGQIIWEFDYRNSKILVINKSQTSKNYSGLPSGKYSFSIFEQNKIEYISVEGKELGLIKSGKDILVINKNETSTGPVSDEYILSFSR